MAISAPMADDVTHLQTALNDSDLTAAVREELESLVASAEASAFWAIAIAGGVGFFKEFGELEAQRLDRGLSALASAIVGVAKRRRVLIVEEVGRCRRLEVEVDSNTPPEAFAQLAELLPEETVVRLTWHKDRGHWCNPFNDRMQERRKEHGGASPGVS